STHQDVFFFTNRGRAFRLKAYEIPEAGRQARGTAAVNLLQLDSEEKITAAFPIPRDLGEAYLVMATKQGIIKKTPIAAFENIRKSGLIALSFKEDDELVVVQLTTGHDELLIGTRRGMAIRFHESDIRPMSRQAAGVRSVDLAPGDEVIDCEVAGPDAHVLALSEYGYGKRSDISDYRLQSRAGKGLMTLSITDKTGKLAGLKVVRGDEDIMIISDEGTIIRTGVGDISVIGRRTQGVRLMRLPDGAKVVRMAVVPVGGDGAEDTENNSEAEAE
ncbi:MAG: DNA gyrase subunit A, partial [Clostridia bacterium]|nr:DNA gyrase subunit A [Clostridia bacterium]